MGYDCTLHVIDAGRIESHFVPRLLGQSQEAASFDERDDAAELWAKVRGALNGEPLDGQRLTPDGVASVVAQLAIAFCAAELPYHYERGFCLSIWPELPEEDVVATVPKKFYAKPEPLFAAITSAYPALKGRFPQEILGNFSTGLYVPAENVPALLEWVRRKTKRFKKPDRRLFRGLLLVLEQAAARGLGYWEGTEIPVPMATMMPPADERRTDLDEFHSPEGMWLSCKGEFPPFILFDHAVPGNCRSALFDFRSWPPLFQMRQEYACDVDRSQDGRWVTASINKADEEQETRIYQCRLQDRKFQETAILPLPTDGENGAVKCGFWNQRVVVMQQLRPIQPYWLLIEEDGALVPFTDMPLHEDQDPTFGIVHLNNGQDVLVWQGNGYCELHGRPVKTYPMEAIAFYAATVFGEAGFFYLSRKDSQLFSIEPDATPILHLPKLSQISALSPGPDGSIMIKESFYYGSGDLGKIYFPDEGTYIRLENELFEDEDPSDIYTLHWMPSCGRLVAATRDRLWAVPIDTVLALPRYNASTDRKLRR